MVSIEMTFTNNIIRFNIEHMIVIDMSLSGELNDIKPILHKTHLLVTSISHHSIFLKNNCFFEDMHNSKFTFKPMSRQYV